MCKYHYDKWRSVTNVKRTFNDGLKAEVLRALPGTAPEVAKKVGCCHVTAMRWLKALHGKSVRISDWRRAKGPFVPVWSKGREPDAECTLEPVGRDEIQRQYRQRAKARAEAAKIARLPKQSWFSPLEIRP